MRSPIMFPLYLLVFAQLIFVHESSAASISGRVTDSDDQSIEGVYVEVYRWSDDWHDWEQVSSGSTDTNGYYSLGGLISGTYRVRFEDYNQAYAPEVYYDIPGTDLNNGTDIDVPAESTVTNIDAALAMASRIEGRVMDSNESPLEGIYVSVAQWNGSWWSQREEGSTDSEGKYSFGGLPAGSYKVGFNDWANYQYISQVFSNRQDRYYWDNGPYDPVIVDAGETASDINAVMLEYATISGAVYRHDDFTAIANCMVVLRSYDNGEFIDRTYTDNDGRYQFDRIPPGLFALHAGPSEDGLSLAQWLGGVTLVPESAWYGWYNFDIPAPIGSSEVVVYGEDISGLDFALPIAGRISGTVVAVGSIPVSNALVRVVSATNRFYLNGFTYAYTSPDGSYEINGLYPDDYQIKVEAPSLKDEWWNNAHHRNGAENLYVNTGDHVVLNFNLEPGQSPAYFEITSDPSGAIVFLDFYPTTNHTPITLDVGEAGFVDEAGNPLAPRYVSVLGTNGAMRELYDYDPLEADTISIHFDLNEADIFTGSLSIHTEPNGLPVYVDRLDMPAGASPVVVSNLATASGFSHMIFVDAPGYLTPRPIRVDDPLGDAIEVVIPLSPVSTTNRIMTSVKSIPHGAQVYVNYMETTNLTDVVVDWLDPTTHGSRNAGWQSASHTIMVKRKGFRQTAPRYIPEEPGIMHPLMVNMTVTPEDAIDENHDGIPDQVAEAYGLDQIIELGRAGADGDADGDGVSNINEILAGTNPMDPNDTFESTTAPKLTGQLIEFTFNSIPGRSYLVMCSADLTNPQWTYASGVVLATEDQTTVSLTTPEGLECRFFRVVVLTR